MRTFGFFIGCLIGFVLIFAWGSHQYEKGRYYGMHQVYFWEDVARSTLPKDQREQCVRFDTDELYKLTRESK